MMMKIISVCIVGRQARNACRRLHRTEMKLFIIFSCKNRNGNRTFRRQRILASELSTRCLF